MNLLTKASLWSLIAVLILLGVILCACGGPAQDTPTDAQQTPTPTYTQEPPPLENGVEVVYFHRSQRCQKCLYLEACVTYTVETYFQDELASGDVVFRVLNVQDESNAVMVEKYGAYGSSLYVSTVVDGTDHIEHVTDIWFVVGDDEACSALVKAEIEEHLGE
jgi:hypothetical protein